MRILISALLLIYLGACSAESIHPFWADKAVRIGDGIRVHIGEDVGAVDVQRKGTENKERVNLTVSNRLIMLHDGDIAYLRGSPHDGCALVVERRASKIGIQINAYHRPHGLPAVLHNEFVVVDEEGED